MKLLKNICFLILLMKVNPILSQIKLPNLISDGVILQRNVETVIWGWSSPNEDIQLFFKQNSYKTKADNKGKWEILLSPQKEGGPYQMTFQGKNKVEVKDVLFGDVWICAGQSNMELSIERVKEKYPDEIKNSNRPEIRQFLVPQEYDFKTERTSLSSGRWISANPQTVQNFSAVGYFFSKNISEHLNIPIGIINTAVGGSPIESWLNEEALKQFSDSYLELHNFKSDSLINSIQQKEQQNISNWYKELNFKDEGLKKVNHLPWYSHKLNDNNWKKMQVPGSWAYNAIGKMNGSVWFRKEVDIPVKLANKKAKLYLGRIIDQDSVYINSSFVGTTGYQYPPRRYQINEGILKPGKNQISVRIINNSGNGGFVLDKPYYIAIGKDTIDLRGEWKYEVGSAMPTAPRQTFIRWKPAGLYNAMIAPIQKMKIKGVLWYQGESNTSNPEKYKEAFPMLIKTWRKNWEQDDFPFLFVQLANYMQENQYPGESNWAELREAQLQTLSVPQTGMVVSIDLGEWNDIHPLNKKTVGERLALLAKKVAYGKNVVSGGPIYESFTREGDSIVINFRDTGDGLLVKNGGRLQQFAIAGKDGEFVWANAEIRGDKVVVYSPEINNPVAVRYAWADNPEGANLFNKNGFPASPFRTDEWE